MSGPLLVECTGVARTYGSGAAAVVAVHGIDCTIAPGQRIAVTGPSGSGKSTLLHLLAGLDRPTTGTITWPALGGPGADARLRPGPVTVVFQSPALLPSLDAAENVALPLVLAGEAHATALDAARHALESLGVADVAGKLPEEISGGQAQRVAVARALVGEPQLIVADEPTGQLDHATAGLVVDTLLAAVTALGAALVLATHDPQVAGRLPCRWPMRDGTRVAGAEELSCSA